MCLLIPWWGAREQYSNRNSDHAHIAKGTGKYRGRAGSGEEEQGGAADGGKGEMANTIRDPCENVKNWVGVCGEDVGNVRSIEDIFECREDSNPDVRPILSRDKPSAHNCQ